MWRAALLSLSLCFHGTAGTDSRAAPSGEAAADSTSALEDCLPCGDEEEPVSERLAGLLGVGSEGGLQVGMPAPSFALQTLDGKRMVRSREVFAGRPLTVLIFWDSYCPKCLRALIECSRFVGEADSLGVGVLSINFDYEHMSAVQAFVEGEKLPFSVLWDADKQVAGAYRALAFDISLFAVDSQGRMRVIHYGRPAEPLLHLRAEVRRALQAIARENAAEEEDE